MLQLIIKMININPSARHPILEECHTLNEYAKFIQTIRDYINTGQNRDFAITAAMEHCVREGIMVDFINKHGSEVRNMLFTEFNMEDALEVYGEEKYEDGFQDGMIRSFIEVHSEIGVSREEIFQKLMFRFKLDEQKAEESMEKYWEK